MTGVSADTPLGEMWFASTDEAVEHLRLAFPGTCFQFERLGNASIAINADGSVTS